MPAPGFFELYPAARPPLPAGTYTATTNTQLQSAPPHGDGAIPVDDSTFHIHIDSPRYVLPPSQVLSTFPPAGARGDWRERLPQIVLKQRTLPWERNPDPAQPFETSPPWLALVVLADGEGRLSPDVDVAQCVTPGVNLGADADAPKGKYLEVNENIVKKVFPCRDELHLLAHVRKVDLSDTELALGDDDGYLSVVLANRLPQPGPIGADGTATPLKYTAYLVNLEHQLDELLPTEPDPSPFFDALDVEVLVDTRFLAAAPSLPLDAVAMNLSGAMSFERGIGSDVAALGLAPFSAASGTEVAPAAWATGPVIAGVTRNDDLAPAREWKQGIGDAIFQPLVRTLRFPVLLSWEFVCTGDGGFERLMNALEVGLLGTVRDDEPAPVPDVAATGHVALAHRSRRGEAATSWYRGPLSPQPTVRTEAGPSGVVPIAHAADQLRKVVPDGREDISLAAGFEIGRLLTLSKPGIVAALMAWRQELFGAARAHQLGDLLTGSVFAGLGSAVAGGRNPLEELVRTHLVHAMAEAPPDQLGPRASLAASRVPRELADLAPNDLLSGLGADPREVRAAAKFGGADGLGAVTIPVREASTTPVSQDREALAGLRAHLGERVERLTVDALNMRDAPPPGRGRRRDAREARDGLDALIAEAEARDNGGPA